MTYAPARTPATTGRSPLALCRNASVPSPVFGGGVSVGLSAWSRPSAGVAVVLVTSVSPSCIDGSHHRSGRVSNAGIRSRNSGIGFLDPGTAYVR